MHCSPKRRPASDGGGANFVVLALSICCLATILASHLAAAQGNGKGKATRESGTSRGSSAVDSAISELDKLRIGEPQDVQGSSGSKSRKSHHRRGRERRRREHKHKGSGKEASGKQKDGGSHHSSNGSDAGSSRNSRGPSRSGSRSNGSKSRSRSRSSDYKSAINRSRSRSTSSDYRSANSRSRSRSGSRSGSGSSRSRSRSRSGSRSERSRSGSRSGSRSERSRSGSNGSRSSSNGSRSGSKPGPYGYKSLKKHPSLRHQRSMGRSSDQNDASASEHTTVPAVEKVEAVPQKEVLMLPRPVVVATIWYENGERNVSLCLGSLISPNWVQSAAHCVQNDDGRLHPKFEILVGSIRVSVRASAQTVFTKLGQAPPDDSAGEQGADLALIKLPKPLNNVPTVPLYCGNRHIPYVIFSHFENARRLVAGRTASLDCKEALASLTPAAGQLLFDRLICTSLVVVEGSSGGPLFAQIDSQKVAQIAVASQQINYEHNSDAAVNIFNRVDCPWIHSVAQDSAIVYVR